MSKFIIALGLLTLAALGFFTAVGGKEKDIRNNGAAVAVVAILAAVAVTIWG